MWPYADGESYLERRQASWFLALVARHIDANIAWAARQASVPGTNSQHRAGYML